jgi:hypothetical protein
MSSGLQLSLRNRHQIIVNANSSLGYLLYIFQLI